MTIDWCRDEDTTKETKARKKKEGTVLPLVGPLVGEIEEMTGG
jgi:hypothetical protein